MGAEILKALLTRQGTSDKNQSKSVSTKAWERICERFAALLSQINAVCALWNQSKHFTFSCSHVIPAFGGRFKNVFYIKTAMLQKQFLLSVYLVSAYLNMLFISVIYVCCFYLVLCVLCCSNWFLSFNCCGCDWCKSDTHPIIHAKQGRVYSDSNGSVCWYKDWVDAKRHRWLNLGLVGLRSEWGNQDQLLSSYLHQSHTICPTSLSWHTQATYSTVSQSSHTWSKFHLLQVGGHQCYFCCYWYCHYVTLPTNTTTTPGASTVITTACRACIGQHSHICLHFCLRFIFSLSLWLVDNLEKANTVSACVLVFSFCFLHCLCPCNCYLPHLSLSHLLHNLMKIYLN